MTTPSGGQQTNGSAPGDILTSGIFDFLIYWLIQWINWLAADAHDTRFLPQGFVGGISTGTPTVVAGSVTGNGAADTYFWPIDALSLGDKVVNVTFYYERLASPGDLVLDLIKNDFTTSTLTVVATRTVSSGSGLSSVEFASDVNYDMQAGHRLYLRAVLNLDNRVFGSVVEFTRNKT